jgi:exopolysaccharide production protein ExoZ
VSPTENKISGLQVARALAALSVAYFHSGNLLIYFQKPEGLHPLPFLMQYGGYGVNFFFAISGFVICIVSRGANFDRASFLIKRAFRIYPPWLLALALYVIVAIPKVRPWSPTDTPEFIFKSIALLPTHDYPLLAVGWSLQHEIAFYLLAALLIPLGGTLALAAFLLTVAVIHQFVELPWWAASFAAHYSDFLAGIVAYWARDRLKNVGSLLPFGVAAVCFWLLVNWNSTFRFAPAWFFLVVGFANLHVQGISGKLVETLGDASYSIYLLHPIVFSWLLRVLPYGDMPAQSQEPVRYAALAITCVAAVCSWHLIEARANRFARELTPLRPAALANPE